MQQLFTFITLIIMTHPISAQNWPAPDLYPFSAHYQEVSAGRLHYIDEGQGDVILFVHGTPTWSFLYRDFVKELSRDYRCIAVDHLGFGLSDKPVGFGGHPQDHARNLDEFVAALDLRDVTLVVHDFGGPIGLAMANAQAHRIKRIVLFNSWLWETASNPAAQKVDKLVRSWLGRFLYLHLNVSPKILLKKGFSNKKQLSKTVHRHYIRPFPTKASRYPLLHLAQSLVGASDWYQLQWEKLKPLEEKSWLVLWGMKDEFITPEYLQKWRDRLPAAQLAQMDAGHFVQEEQPQKAIEIMRRWMQETDGNPLSK